MKCGPAVELTENERHRCPSSVRQGTPACQPSTPEWAPPRSPAATLEHCARLQDRQGPPHPHREPRVMLSRADTPRYTPARYATARASSDQVRVDVSRYPLVHMLRVQANGQLLRRNDGLPSYEHVQCTRYPAFHTVLEAIIHSEPEDVIYLGVDFLILVIACSRRFVDHHLWRATMRRKRLAESLKGKVRTPHPNVECKTLQKTSLLKCVWVAAAPVLCLHSRGTASRSTRQASGSHRRDARSPAACC